MALLWLKFCDVYLSKGCELVGGFDKAWKLGVEANRIKYPRYEFNTTTNLQYS